jgi:hypothetical protein
MLRTLTEKESRWSAGGLAPLAYLIPPEGGTIDLKLSKSDVQALVREADRLGHRPRDVEAACLMALRQFIGKLSAEKLPKGLSPQDRMILLLSGLAEKTEREPTVFFFSTWGYHTASIANRLSFLCTHGLMYAEHSKRSVGQGRRPMMYFRTAEGDELADHLAPLDEIEKDPDQFNSAKKDRLKLGRRIISDKVQWIDEAASRHQTEREAAAYQRMEARIDAEVAAENALPVVEVEPEPEPVPEGYLAVTHDEDLRPQFKIDRDGPQEPIFDERGERYQPKPGDELHYKTRMWLEDSELWRDDRKAWLKKQAQVEAVLARSHK